MTAPPVAANVNVLLVGVVATVHAELIVPAAVAYPLVPVVPTIAIPSPTRSP